jgi:hypothetical protein
MLGNALAPSIELNWDKVDAILDLQLQIQLKTPSHFILCNTIESSKSKKGPVV